MNVSAIKSGVTLALTVSQLSVTCIAVGCAQRGARAVDENWGGAYRAAMEGQMARQPSESRDAVAVEGFDSASAELVMENYQDDVRRTSGEARETFIIGTGVRDWSWRIRQSWRQG
jgi:hypothetical protein